MGESILFGNRYGVARRQLLVRPSTPSLMSRPSMIYTAWKWPPSEMASDSTWRLSEAILTSRTKVYSPRITCISYFSTRIIWQKTELRGIGLCGTRPQHYPRHPRGTGCDATWITFYGRLGTHTPPFPRAFACQSPE